MISGLIPHRYALALYKYAMETGAVETIYGYMKSVVTACRDNAQLVTTLANPYVATEAKRKLMTAMAGARPDDTYLRFVKLVLDHKREEYFELMALAYRDIYREKNHISQVRISTAVKMSADEEKRIKDVVQKAYPESKFEYQIVVNPELIGGFVIDVDSTRLDASISGELEQLRQNLLTGK